MPLEQVRPILASDLAANCSSSAAHLEAALSMPDSRTSLAAAMSFLVSPTAMNGTFDSKTGVPPLMARSDAVAVVMLGSPLGGVRRFVECCWYVARELYALLWFGADIFWLWWKLIFG